MRRAIGIALALMLALAVATAAFADCTGEVTNAHAQMNCCTNEFHQCSKTGNPDDCCRRMRDAGPSVLLAPTPVSPLKVPVVRGIVTLLSAPTVTIATTVTTPTVRDFKRPHDPPHLHSFARLI